MSDELENLFVSGKEIDKKMVGEILKPYLRIDKETCDIRPLSSWGEVKAYNKILLYLLARKAMKAHGLDLEEESASATEIIRNTGLKKGTVNPALRGLFDGRVVAQDEKRKYFVPNYALEEVKSMISDGKSEGGNVR